MGREGQASHSLAGRRVLLVEDEYYIADDVRRVLTLAGAEVVGPMSTIETANAALDRGTFDCAVIDLNLHGQSAVGIADRLLQDGCAFIIATGYGSRAIPEHLMAIPRIEKPFELQRLVQMLLRASTAKIG